MKQAGSRATAEAPARPDACARMYLHDLIDRIFNGDGQDLQNYCADIEPLLQLVGCNPGLKQEVACLQQIQKAGFRLVDLQTAARGEFEARMSAGQDTPKA